MARLTALSVVTVATMAVMAVMSGCQPRTDADQLLLNTKHPLCRFESLTKELSEDAQLALQVIGTDAGRLGSTPGAVQYAQRQTHDGYLVRSFASSLVMALALFGLGGLVAALILTLGQRRPTARWAERLTQSLAREIDQLRALAKAGDAFTKELVSRFDEPLTAASQKAQRLLQRALPLAKRDGAPTAHAHLESLHGQLEGLLALVERAHLQVLTWQERQHSEERGALTQQIDAVLASLQSALKEASV